MKILPGTIVVVVFITFAVDDAHGGLFDVLIDIPITITRVFTHIYADLTQYFRTSPSTNRFPRFKRRKAMREISEVEQEPWPFKFDRPSRWNSDTSLMDLSDSSSDMKTNLNYRGSKKIHNIRTEDMLTNRIRRRKNPASRPYLRGRRLPPKDGLPYVPDNNVLI